MNNIRSQFSILSYIKPTLPPLKFTTSKYVTYKPYTEIIEISKIMKQSAFFNKLMKRARSILTDLSSLHDLRCMLEQSENSFQFSNSKLPAAEWSKEDDILLCKAVHLYGWNKLEKIEKCGVEEFPYFQKMKKWIEPKVLNQRVQYIIYLFNQSNVPKSMDLFKSFGIVSSNENDKENFLNRFSNKMSICDQWDRSELKSLLQVVDCYGLPIKNPSEKDDCIISTILSNIVENITNKYETVSYKNQFEYVTQYNMLSYPYGPFAFIKVIGQFSRKTPELIEERCRLLEEEALQIIDEKIKEHPVLTYYTAQKFNDTVKLLQNFYYNILNQPTTPKILKKLSDSLNKMVEMPHGWVCEVNLKIMIDT